jgi:hypothetical protein
MQKLFVCALTMILAGCATHTGIIISQMPYAREHLR